MAVDAVRSFAGRGMKVIFKTTSALLEQIKGDLHRPHPFAHERVGFISEGLSWTGSDLMALARGYRPVSDCDYLNDPSVGAMMGPAAIRKALEWAMQNGHALFHVHSHGGRGVPGFSSVDLRENKKFVPGFFKVTPACAHGALVLSDNRACGQIWVDLNKAPIPVTDFAVVGATVLKWRAA